MHVMLEMLEMELELPGGFSEFAMDFFVDINIKGSLDKGQGHLQCFHS